MIEKSTRRILSGNSAPTVQNLKQWLKDHPTFQVRQSPAATNQAFMMKKEQLKDVAKKMKVQAKSDGPKLFSQPTKIQTKLKFESQQKLVLSSPKGDMSPGTSKQQQQVHRKSVDLKSPTLAKTSPFAAKTATPKTVEKPKVKRQPSGEQRSLFSSPVDSSKATQELRFNVRKTLKEQLITRTKEITDAKAPRLTEAEIETFSDQVELEMFELFNKDTGHKYKAKYRTLMFNIRDRKNLTLFQKICEKGVPAAQLVRMEPQELASQELAAWRENESKHQLEMIKKSELELLACSKNYVLKTHKGEEVVEDKSTDRVELDPSVAVEDVVSALNSNVTSTTEEVRAKQPETEAKYVKSYTHEDAHSSKKKDAKRRSRSRSRDRRGKHKRRRSRSRSRDRRERSRSRDRRARSRDHHHHEKKKHERRSPERKHEKRDKSRGDKRDEKPAAHKVEDYNLVDKILEASQAIVSSGRLDVEKIAREQAASEKHHPVESDQEPTSTVTIPTPPHPSSPVETLQNIWSGVIKMIDVASFKLDAQPVSGEVEHIIPYLPATLDVVGRIAPETVYDYIGKIKKIPNREIIIIRFSSLDTVAYVTMYKYHEQRRRLGVIKTNSASIKDFYLLPLPAEKKVPAVLQPIKGVGFIEGDQKPDLLLGVIVRLTGPIKRSEHKTRVSMNLNPCTVLG